MQEQQKPKVKSKHPRHTSKHNAALKNAVGSDPNTVVLQRQRLVDGKFTMRLKKKEEEEEKKEQAGICFSL